MTSAPGILVALLTGCGAMAHAFPAWRYRPAWLGWLLLISTGAAAGVGIHSFACFLLIWAGAATPPLIWMTDLALAAASAGLAWRFTRYGPFKEVARQRFQLSWLPAVAAVLAVLLTGAAIVDTTQAQPYGDWDAWSMWNLRARYLTGPGDTWRNAISPDLSRSSPDYPLLLPVSIARLWRMTGDSSPEAPRLFGLLMLVSAAGILFGTLAEARGLGAALLAMLALSANASFLSQGSAQYADVPLSAFMLGALALALLKDDPAALAAAGWFAACAAWTKNEGAVFCALLLTGTLVFRGWRPFRWVLAGAAPGLAVVIAFKLLLAPKSIFVAQTTTQMLGKIADAGRWGQIASVLGSEISNLGLVTFAHPLLLLAVLALGLRFEKGAPWRFPVTVLALQFAAYVGAYLVTPLDLQWQAATSSGRLLAQIWPSLLFTCMLSLCRLEDLIPFAPSLPSASPTRSSVPRPGSAKSRRAK